MPVARHSHGRPRDPERRDERDDFGHREGRGERGAEERSLVLERGHGRGIGRALAAVEGDEAIDVGFGVGPVEERARRLDLSWMSTVTNAFVSN